MKTEHTESTRKKLTRREFLRAAALFTTAMVAAACSSPSRFALPLVEGDKPEGQPQPETIPGNEIFTAGDLEIIASLINKTETVYPPRTLYELQTKIVRLITTQLREVIFQSPDEANLATSLITQVEQPSLEPENLHYQIKPETQERWQTISVYLYLYALLLQKAEYPQNAFNIFCLNNMFLPSVVQPATLNWGDYYYNGESVWNPDSVDLNNPESARTFLLQYAYLDTNQQLANLVQANSDITPNLETLNNNLLWGIDQHEFEQLLQEAEDVESMPVRNGEEIDAKRADMERLLWQFYYQMSQDLLRRGVFVSEAERQSWITKQGLFVDRWRELIGKIEFQNIPAFRPETKTYSYLVDVQKQTISGSAYNSEDKKIDIPPVMFATIQRYVQQNHSYIPSDTITTVANLKATVADLNQSSDDEIINYAINNRMLLIDHCSHRQIDPGEGDVNPRWCTLIALTGLRSNDSNNPHANFMIAIPDDSPNDVILLSGSNYRVVAEHQQDLRVKGAENSSGYTITEILKLLQTFYSNPDLHMGGTGSPSQLLATSFDSLETQIRPGMHAVYIPPEANLYGLEPATEGNYLATNLTNSLTEPFGDLGTMLTLHESIKITALYSKTGENETFYIIQAGDNNRIVAVRAKDVVTVQQRTYLQYLRDSAHSTLFWVALIGNYPITIDRVQPLGNAMIDATTGTKVFETMAKKIGFKGFPIPAGIQRLGFKFLEQGKEVSHAKTLVAGLPIEIVTEKVVTETHVGEVIQGAKIVERTALQKVFQIFQAISAYLIIKSLTADQRSDLEALMIAATPYFQQSAGIYDERNLAKFGAETIQVVQPCATC